MERIVIIAAMELEYAAISARLPPNQSHGTTVVQSGVGLVNAGIATHRAIEQFNPEAVISLGVAGSLTPQLEIGQTIVARQILQHDAIYSGAIREFMAPGELHLSLAPDARKSPWVATDPKLTQWLSNALQAPTCSLLSGSEFVGTISRKTELAAIAPDAFAVEMEAAAVAQICTKRNIPFAVVKTIADSIRPDGNIATDYLAFAKSAAATAAQLIDMLLKRGH